MHHELPKPVAESFAAEKAGDANALARCFVEDGVVRDDLAPGRLIESVANSPYAVVFRSWGETVNRPVESTWTSHQRQNAVLPPS